MYSSVKEHRVCVNTSSSLCHMDSAAAGSTGFLKTRRGKEDVSFAVDLLCVCWIFFKTTGMTARDVHCDNMTHDLSEVSAGGTF